VVVAAAPGHVRDPPPSKQRVPPGCPGPAHPAQREQFTSFINKATGWFTVAVGATLLAAEQTWQVIDRHRWPVWLFWLLIIVMLGASVLNTAVRMIRSEQVAGSGGQQADEDSPPPAPS
jgi:hypothetical protein